MKKLLVVFVLTIGTICLTSFTEKNNQSENIKTTLVTDYCDGWKDGYCEGWKDVKGQFAVCPVTPVCPVAEVGKNTYKGGYNRGFKKGMKDAKK